MITILSDESTRNQADAVYCHLAWMKQYGQAIRSNLAGFGGLPDRTKAYVAILSPKLLAYPDQDVVTWLTQDDDVPLFLLDAGIRIPAYLQDCLGEYHWIRGEKVEFHRLQTVVMGAIIR